MLLAVQVVRNAAVEALAPLQPDTAAWFWPTHPSVETAVGLAEIGRASRGRRPINPKIFQLIDDAATKAPLSPEPFLVRGVEAQTAGNVELATRAFIAAQSRDPRSMAAAYFLADHYVRSGDPLRGLEETALLARLSPEGANAVAPYVAAYAQNRSNWRQIQELFRSQADLEDSVLTVLARDGRNAEAILALADSSHRSAQSAWLPVLVGSLVAQGDYRRARAIWSSIGGAKAGSSLIYDADFAPATAPPPFNWSLASSTVGLAERQPAGRLHAIFYGNEDGVLASQLLLLPPGSYRLDMQMIGTPTHPDALRWVVKCDKSTAPLAAAGIQEVAARGWTFVVPGNCPAQSLELAGRSGDVSQQSDVTIGRLKLMSALGNA